MEKLLKELIKSTVGRRKKIFNSSLRDLKLGNIKLGAEDGAFTAAVIQGTVRRAKDPKQAIAEYARILRPKSPALIILWTGPSFKEASASSLIALGFDVKSTDSLKTEGERTLIAFTCRKK
jgi:ubiquinone/menaquinone biosynthesis C-methylase UbiE